MQSLGQRLGKMSWVRTMTVRVGSHKQKECTKVEDETNQVPEYLVQSCNHRVLGKDQDFPGRKVTGEVA